MLVYCLKRIIFAVPTLAIVIAITFTLGFYAPGDPLIAMYGETMPPSEDALAQLHKAYGLDRPYVVQLADYAQAAVRGDFGDSITLRRDVSDAMRAKLPISLQLGLGAMLLLTVVGVPLSILAALRHNSAFDHAVVATTVSLSALPSFVLIPLILVVFVLKLNAFDVPTGWHGLFSTATILPVAVLAVGPLSWFIRTFRAAILEALNAGHVRTASAKGLAHPTVVVWHVIRNALPAGVSALALCVPGFFVGAFFVESIFAIPGFGSLTVRALQQYDYPLILGSTIVTAAVVIGTNLVADLICALLEPGDHHA